MTKRVSKLNIDLMMNVRGNEIDKDIGHAQEVVEFWTMKVDNLLDKKREHEAFRAILEQGKII